MEEVNPTMRFHFSSLLLVAVASLLHGTSLRAEPAIVPNAVFKPTFLFTGESFYAGTAFAAKLPGSPQVLLVTCHHLFGPAAGLEKQMSAEDVASDVVGTVGVSMSDPKVILVATRYLKVPGARPFDGAGCDKDLALFEFPAASAVLPVAAKPARLGDKVWLCARLAGTTKLALYPAVVSFVNAVEIDYVFEKNDIELRATSGAPVLAESGEVVAINLGGGTQKGKTFGFGNPAASIAAVLGKK